MEKETLKALLSFSRRERIGIMMLLFCVAAAFIWPCFLSSPVMGSDAELAGKLARQLAADSAGQAQEDDSTGGSGHEKMRERYAYPETRWKGKQWVHDKNPPVNGPLFYFDPNTISAEEWGKLGLRERTVGTVMRYVSSGGRFRKAEDLQKIYGLSPEIYERLAPFVRIASALPKDSIRRSGGNNAHDRDGTGNDGSATMRGAVHDVADLAKLSIDINLADSAAWEALPGIGGRLAQRILRFRERLGGFYSVDQLMDVYGIPDSVFRRLQPFLRCAAMSLKKIDINTADARELKQHPYMSWNMANALVQYRRQHGPFRSPDELLRIAVGDEATLRKMLPYIGLN